MYEELYYEKTTEITENELVRIDWLGSRYQH
jgi:hypothetical protein